MLKTNYAAHDLKYRRLRNDGAPGWDTIEGYREREIGLRWALDALGPCDGRRVLELGCGAGNMAGWLVNRGMQVTGIDISPTAIAWANEQAVVGARYIVGDVVVAIPGQYELVIDGQCLHCIIGDDRARLLAHVHNALVPGGAFFVSTMCGEITIPALQACFDPATRCQVVDGIAYRFIGDAAGLLDELRTAGFEIDTWTICPRNDDDDQDHLWAIAKKPV